MIFGLTEATAHKGVVYNTTALIGPAGLVGTYRKVHLAVAERFFLAPRERLARLRRAFGADRYADLL